MLRRPKSELFMTPAQGAEAQRLAREWTDAFECRQEE